MASSPRFISQGYEVLSLCATFLFSFTTVEIPTPHVLCISLYLVFNLFLFFSFTSSSLIITSDLVFWNIDSIDVKYYFISLKQLFFIEKL